MLPLIAIVEFWLCWIAWMLAFVAARKRAAGQVKSVRAPASRWGIVCQGIGFALIFIRIRPAGFEKSELSLIVSMILAPLAALLGWAGATNLGKQWRFEAALSEDHELVQTGPYRYVRHPIYASMLLLLLAAGAAATWWPMFVAGVVMFLIGTEIRTRLEDRLLADRFGEQFAAYRAKVSAYIPMIR
jgi:protein-S-isoprenylcysteine O-methyltransferase Ste14